MHKWTGDIISIVLVVGSMYLLTQGIDGEVKSILTVAAGYIFAVNVLRAKSKGG